MLSYFPNHFTAVKLWNRTQSRAELLRNELNELYPDNNVDIVVVNTPHECVIGADCIVTATNSSIPLFDVSDLKANVHINGESATFYQVNKSLFSLY
jgi:ornithine cyclodeaminase